MSAGAAMSVDGYWLVAPMGGGATGYRRITVRSRIPANLKRRSAAANAVPGTGVLKDVLSASQIEKLEGQFPDGITAVQLVDVMSSRGIRLSEATFRKYVQLGLLPRSRRVGRKGKHRGSLGVYPAKTIRKVNAIKAWMNEGFTIQQIQERLVAHAEPLEVIEGALEQLFTSYEALLGEMPADKGRKQVKALHALREEGAALLTRLQAYSEAFKESRTIDIRRRGAAESAEELL